MIAPLVMGVARVLTVARAESAGALPAVAVVTAAVEQGAAASGASNQTGFALVSCSLA